MCDKLASFLTLLKGIVMSTPRILITGANTGIGYATAERLVKQGAHVILACRNLDKAHAAQQQL